jgi:Mechanosensitive ion channel, conserved TM helix
MQAQALQTPAGPLAHFSDQVFAYLPALAAGLAVLALGILVGWLAKHVVVRAMVWLRLDRLGGRTGWRAAFGKGDVRAAMYDLVGNIVMIGLILVFLDNGLQIWGLNVLSSLIEHSVFYLPNLGLVALIVVVGFLVSNVVGVRVTHALEDEGFERSRLVGRAVKGVLQAVVGALALWQLGFAREIVLGAFYISFGAIGVAFALAVGLGAGRAVQSALARVMERGDHVKTSDRADA